MGRCTRLKAKNIIKARDLHGRKEERKGWNWHDLEM